MMGLRTMTIALACGALVSVAIPAVGQESLRTAWGTPDLQGVWDFRTITPLERPEERADQEFLSEEETANLEQEVVDRNEELLHAEARRTEVGGNVGGYNNFWMDRGTTSTGRTSLVTDPPNGRIPPTTEAGGVRRTKVGSFNVEIPTSYT